MTSDFAEQRLAHLLTQVQRCRAVLQLDQPEEALFDPVADLAIAAAELANRVAPEGYQIVVKRKDWRES